MTFAYIVDKFLDGSYPVPMMLLIVVIAGIVIVVLSKRMLSKLNIATKDDITELREEIAQLRGETKSDIAQLREETKSDIAELREEIAQLRGETKSDIAELREETKSGIAELRKEVNHRFQQLQENDLYHTNRAILIMSKELISDPNVYKRIEDTILETTPNRLRDEIRRI
ncbi:MAG: apolipoprotein A1/A4/E family protein [Spirochaetaceae bacterium]|jgi:F0F1-type ATP synthase membrane subunit b/b'|nr:apolipoprotein A1/A4/E family protein [Spirochaetaceae bacterium]